MGRQAAIVLYVLALVAVVVGVEPPILTVTVASGRRRRCMHNGLIGAAAVLRHPWSVELGLGRLFGTASRGHSAARAQAFLRARISAVLFSRAIYGMSSA
jgi:hypothetical protein